MAIELKLPLLGDVMKEGKLVSWLQPDGAQVTKGAPLYDLETDKINFTVEAPADGLLQQIVPAGDVAPVGATVGRLLAQEDIGQRPSAAVPEKTAERSAAQAVGAGFKPAPEGVMGPAAVGEIRATPAARRLARELGLSLDAVNIGKRIKEADIRAFHESIQAAPAESAWPGPLPEGEGIAAAARVTPAARRLARDLGVDLAVFAADKRVREADVQAYYDARLEQARLRSAAAAEPVTAAVTAARLPDASEATTRSYRCSFCGRGQERVGRLVAGPAGVYICGACVDLCREIIAEPAGMRQTPAEPPGSLFQRKEDRVTAFPETRELTGRRRIIAERMHASLQQMAQLSISMEVDMTEAMRLRGQLKQLWPENAQPTVTAAVLRAVGLALREYPYMNATLEDVRLTVHPTVNIGLAIDADEGLIVPVIRNAGDMSLRELAERSRVLAERARTNQLGPDDLQGGTFTVTSMGALGIDVFTPIVNPPQIAILGIGRVFPKLALVDAKVEERSAMYLSLSFDHRAVDGAPAARFLNEVKRFLELPASLLV